MTLREIFNGVLNLFNNFFNAIIDFFNAIIDFDLTYIIASAAVLFYLWMIFKVSKGMILDFKNKKWNIYQYIGLVFCYLIMVGVFILAVAAYFWD